VDETVTFAGFLRFYVSVARNPRNIVYRALANKLAVRNFPVGTRRATTAGRWLADWRVGGRAGGRCAALHQRVRVDLRGSARAQG
jgi:hypothetical protein